MKQIHPDMNCQDIFDKGDGDEGDVGDRDDDKGDGDEGDVYEGDGDEGDDDEGDGDEGDDDASTQDTMGIPPPDILTAGFVPSTGIFTVLRPTTVGGGHLG